MANESDYGIVTPTDNSFSLNKLFGDPNLQSLLAGIATGIDPNGPGGILGKAATGFIQSRAAQKAVTQQDTQRKASNLLLAAKSVEPGSPEHQQYIKQATDLLGGLTSPEKAGVNSVKMGNKGNVIYDVNHTDIPALPTNTANLPQSSTPTAPVTENNTNISSSDTNRRINLNDVIPFY